MTDKKSAPTYRVPALEKGLEVLEILADAQEPLSLSQISAMTDKNTSELFRTLNCLVEQDYVAREDVSNKYWLTLKLFEMSHRHSPLEHLLQAANLPMQELARTLEESCHLSVIRRNRLLVLTQTESPNKVRISVSVGASFSLIHTVSGRLLLAALPNDQLEGLLANTDEYLELAIIEREQLWQRLHHIRATGISNAVDESYVGLQDTAVLVGSPSSGISAALAVTQLTVSKQHSDTQQTVKALLDCAQVINLRAGLSAQWPAHPQLY